MKFTSDQLKLNAAAMIAFADGKPIEYDPTGEGAWTKTTCVDGIHRMPHRPTPEPKTRPWNRPEDVPGPVCWLRNPEHSTLEGMIVALSQRSITWITSEVRHLLWDDPEITAKLSRLEYSTDRKTWHPCEVPE